MAAAVCACSSPADSIRVNQVGFYPDQEKTLTLEQNNKCETVEIYKAGTLKRRNSCRTLYNQSSEHIDPRTDCIVFGVICLPH